MSNFRSLRFTLSLAISLIAMTACVPKATEKKAICGANQAFSSVTRSCYSIEEVRHKPVATTSVASLAEETPKTIELTYTDGNKDNALTCKIVNMSANIEMISGGVADRSIFVKADEVSYAASSLGLLLTPGNSTAGDAIYTSLDKARASQYYPNVAAKLGLFKLQVESMLASAAAVFGNVPVTYEANIVKEKMQALIPLLNAMENRCECAAGKCYTTIIPKYNKSGAANFTYTVSDADGDSAAKAVAVTIAAMPRTTAHLAPVVMSSTISGAESNTSTPVALAGFTLPQAGDLSEAGADTFTYHFIGTTNGGTVSNCMGLNGTNNYDRTCVYTPPNGDDSNATTFATARIDMGDIRFEAMSAGTPGNDIKIRMYSLQADNSSVDPYITKPGIYGLVNSSYNESFLRVVGNEIRIFMNPGTTTTNDLIDLVNTHPQAKLLVTASTIPSPTGALPIARPLTSLAGGVGAYDTIKYYVKNSAGVSSTNTAAVSVRIEPTDDLPALITPLVAARTVVEDSGPFIIDLKPFFTDVDTNGTTNFNLCSADFTYDMLFFNPNFAFSINAATCEVTLTPNANVSSATNTYDFQFRVGTRSTVTGITQWLPTWVTYKVTVTPVNDLPEMSMNALTMLPLVAIPGQTILEDGSGYVDLYVGPGGGGFESTQTVTLSATSSDPILLPNANITISDSPGLPTGRKRISYTTAANRSGSVVITYKATDSLGATTALPLPTFTLTVTPVNDPPTITPAVLPNLSTNEGGTVQSAGIIVDEDEGGSPDENVDGITITIHSDNTAVLPSNATGAITLFYDVNNNGVEDSGEGRTAVVTAGKLVFSNIEGTASLDSALHKFYLKLDPIDGLNGNANITLTASDGVNSTSTQFSFIVNPVAALHGGWENISSVGVKRDKNGNPVKVITDSTTKDLTADSDVVCNYNKSSDAKNCSGSDCKGVSPNGTIIPSAKNVLYWDTDNNRCYRSNSNSKYSWVEFNTTCPVVKSTDCTRDNSCIVNEEAVPADNFPNATDIPARIGMFMYSTYTNKCYVSTGKVSYTEWVEFTPSKVTIGWKPFTIMGSGSDAFVTTAGYNVYRREANKDYNFYDGYLRNTASATMSITDPNIMEFTDKTAIAGKVYYYTVRPVDSNHGIATYTPESYSEIRVLAAPANYSFVHRWMVNQEMCNSMHMTTATTPNAVDQSQNYRCPYSGPGEAFSGSTRTGFFDYGKDLLVNTQELGCPYSPAPACSGGACVGLLNTAPSFSTTAGQDYIYYSRATGKCYANTGGTSTWTEFEGSGIIGSNSIAPKLNTSLNAPLVNITQAKAKAICELIPAPAVSGFTLSSTNKLPNKLDFNVYGAHKSNVSDTALMEMEQGFSLNLNSRCNASSASGLESGYTDSAVPSTSLMYSLPGSQSSGIRSIYTGSVPQGNSKGSDACVSRYGVQDVYGNVAEWTLDQMVCPNTITDTSACAADVTIANGSFKDEDFGHHTGNSSAIPPIPAHAINYAFDLVTGPFNELNGDGVPSYIVGPPAYSDGWMGKWTYSSVTYNATKFSFPIAMPIQSDVASSPLQVDLDVLSFILNIGPSNGVTVDKLHEDGIIVNSKFNTQNSGSSGRSSFAVGGSYLSGNLAGRFTSELIPTNVRGPDVGVRCIVPIPSSNYPTDSHTNYPY